MQTADKVMLLRLATWRSPKLWMVSFVFLVLLAFSALANLSGQLIQLALVDLIEEQVGYRVTYRSMNPYWLDSLIIYDVKVESAQEERTLVLVDEVVVRINLINYLFSWLKKETRSVGLIEKISLRGVQMNAMQADLDQWRQIYFQDETSVEGETSSLRRWPFLVEGSEFQLVFRSGKAVYVFSDFSFRVFPQGENVEIRLNGQMFSNDLLHTWIESLPLSLRISANVHLHLPSGEGQGLIDISNLSRDSKLNLAQQSLHLSWSSENFQLRDIAYNNFFLDFQKNDQYWEVNAQLNDFRLNVNSLPFVPSQWLDQVWMDSSFVILQGKARAFLGKELVYAYRGKMQFFLENVPQLRSLDIALKGNDQRMRIYQFNLDLHDEGFAHLNGDFLFDGLSSMNMELKRFSILGLAPLNMSSQWRGHLGKNSLLEASNGTWGHLRFSQFLWDINFLPEEQQSSLTMTFPDFSSQLKMNLVHQASQTSFSAKIKALPLAVILQNWRQEDVRRAYRDRDGFLDLDFTWLGKPSVENLFSGFQTVSWNYYQKRQNNSWKLQLEKKPLSLLDQSFFYTLRSQADWWKIPLALNADFNVNQTNVVSSRFDISLNNENYPLRLHMDTRFGLLNLFWEEHNILHVSRTESKVWMLHSGLEKLPISLPWGTLDLSYYISGQFNSWEEWFLQSQLLQLDLRHSPYVENFSLKTALQAGPSSIDLKNFNIISARGNLAGNGAFLWDTQGFWNFHALFSGETLWQGARELLRVEGQSQRRFSDASWRIFFDGIDSRRIKNLPFQGLLYGDYIISTSLGNDLELQAVMGLEQGKLAQTPFEGVVQFFISRGLLQVPTFFTRFGDMSLADGQLTVNEEDKSYAFRARYLFEEEELYSLLLQGKWDLEESASVESWYQKFLLQGQVSATPLRTNAKPFFFTYQKDHQRLHVESHQESLDLNYFFDRSYLQFVHHPHDQWHLQGEGTIGKVLDFRFQTLRFDIEELPFLIRVPDQFRLYSGMVDGALSLAGSWEDPVFAGSLRLLAAQFLTPYVVTSSSYNEQMQLLGPVDVELVFIEERSLELKKIRFLIPGSRGSEASLEALFILSSWSLVDYRIHINVEKGDGLLFKYSLNEFTTKVRVLGDFSITGDMRSVFLEGDIFADRGDVAFFDPTTSFNFLSRPLSSFINDKKLQENSMNDFSLGLRLTITTGKGINFVWPTLDFPILKAYAANNQRMAIEFDSNTNFFRIDGLVQLRGGYFNYGSVNFALHKGSIAFRETENIFDPWISLEAEARLRDTDGRPLSLQLSADEPLSRLNPQIVSTPAKSIEELQYLIGVEIISSAQENSEGASVTNNAIGTAGSILLSNIVVRPFEDLLRNFLSLDFFSIRLDTINNITGNTQGGFSDVFFGVQDQLLSGNTLGFTSDYEDLAILLFNNAEISFGSYISDRFFLRGGSLLRTNSSYRDNNANYYFTALMRLGLEIEFLPWFSADWGLDWDLDRFPQQGLQSLENNVTLLFSWQF